MEEDGNVKDQYDNTNDDDKWNEFRKRYKDCDNKIALEVSTTGKYVARKLMDMGFNVHMANTSRISLIFKTVKKNDKEDSYKLAKLPRLGELPAVHLPSKYSDDLKSLARYRKSIGENTTMIKNRIHAFLTSYGITIDKTDIFGRSGMKKIRELSTLMSESDKFVLYDIIDQLSDLKERSITVEDQLSKIVTNDESVARIVAISGINVYSASSIISEIDDISRFPSKEKLASYAGLVPRQDQSGNRDLKDYITKKGPSMLIFIIVNAAHTVIKFSKKMKSKYLSLVKCLGKNRAIVAIARLLVEIIYLMLTKNEDFIDQIDSLTEKKMKAMHIRSLKPHIAKSFDEVARLIKTGGMRKMSKEPFS